jgi:hypothetical protein
MESILFILIKKKRPPRAFKAPSAVLLIDHSINMNGV